MGKAYLLSGGESESSQQFCCIGKALVQRSAHLTCIVPTSRYTEICNQAFGFSLHFEDCFVIENCGNKVLNQLMIDTSLDQKLPGTQTHHKRAIWHQRQW